MNKQEKTLQKIAIALDKVNPETQKTIKDMATMMSSVEIIQNFNQTALDFFNLLIDITKKMNLLKEFGMEVYLTFFQQAIKINASMPLDQFTVLILEFAPDIYAENEDFFLNMQIPDGQIQGSFSQNEFSLIRSEKFKNLWKILGKDEKKEITGLITLLTTFAHTYFVYYILNSR